MTIKYLVIDDDDESFALIEQVLKKIRPVELIAECKTADKALHLLNENKINVVFVDPHMTGINNHIREALRRIPFVIIMSSNPGVAKEAFDMGATDFLIKPLSMNRLMKSIVRLASKNLDRVQDSISRQTCFFVKNKSVLIKVFASDIIMVEGLADYVNIYTFKDKYTIHNTMKNMESVLGDRHFIRVHKSYIIRLDSIKIVENRKIIVNDKTVPLSKNYKKALLEKLNIL